MRPYGPASPWRLAPGLTFLNHGSFGACPVPVLDAQATLREAMEANPVRFLARELDDRLAAARATIAAFLGADPEGLVFVSNATAGVSTVLRSLDLAPGDELLTTDQEYNASLVALGAVAGRAGARVVVARLGLPIEGPDQVVERVLAGVTPRTRLALISHITSPTGLVLPIERLVRELDSRGVDTLVDAAHAPGMLPVDLRKQGAAYWTGNGHKWCCAPKGAAVLYAREDRRAELAPLAYSHGWADPRPDRPVAWKRFDWTGTVDPTAFLCLAEAITFMGTLHPDGWPGLQAENRAKAVAGRRRLLAALGTTPLAPESMLGALAAVELPGLARDDAAAAALQAALFDDHAIEVPVLGWPAPAARAAPDAPPDRVLLRISAQRYVEPEDVERLVEALGEMLGGPRDAAARGGRPSHRGAAVHPGPGVAPLTVMQGGRRKAFRPLAVGDRLAAFDTGLAAYRAGEWFEAHELWEPAWMGTSDTAERDLLQGLIKVAAAHVHRERGNGLGMAKNLRGARTLLTAALAAGAPAYGLRLADIIAAVDDRLVRLDGHGLDDAAAIRPIDLGA